MKAELLRRLEMGPTHPEYVSGEKKWLDVGHVIDHPQSFMLVRMGVAKAADDECEKAAQMTATAHQKAVAAYERLEKGIAPEDFDAFDSGEMSGYDPETGEPILGPNAVDEDDD